jgi:membrane-associated phospholipid phosphatase/methionine-rich copper-binding protein CopC
MDNLTSNNSDLNTTHLFGDSTQIGAIDNSPQNIFDVNSHQSSPPQLHSDRFTEHLNNTILPLAQTALREFEQSPDFASKMNLVFGNRFDLQTSKSRALLDSLTKGAVIPIEILPSGQIQAKGAFGKDRIYLSEDLVNPATAKTDEAVSVLLEEIGHYLDSQINAQDSSGDEGAIFAKLVQNQAFNPGELSNLQAEDDRGVINLNGQSIAVEQASLDKGIFDVDATGKLTIDFLADSGSYHSEMAIFSLKGMETFLPGSIEFTQEAARRALSNSSSGYVVISDLTEGAKFSQELGESNKNDGKYAGIKTFNFTAGDRIAMMLVPDGTIKEVFNNPSVDGNKRPLFSIANANPNQANQLGQLLPDTFGWEDMRLDRGGDADYNDFVFQIKGATGIQVDIDKLVAVGKEWQNLPVAKEIFTAIFNDNNPPDLRAGLAEDTGFRKFDRLTYNPEVVGKLTDDSGVKKFRAKFSDGGKFVDILSAVQADGSFTLNVGKLAQIKGSDLTDGYYKLILQAEDKFGKVAESVVEFTLDTQPPAAPTEIKIKDDLDLLTNKNTPTIVGKGDTGSKVSVFDGDIIVGEGFVTNGAWEITTSTLADGIKNLRVKAIDRAGNCSEYIPVSITVDTVKPVAPTEINIKDDPDLITNLTTPIITGKAETGTTVQIFDSTTKLGEATAVNGAFEITTSALTDGVKNLSVKSIDLAGNVSDSTAFTITVDTTKPVINVSLLNDTGANISDRVTSDGIITGKVTDANSIAKFQAKLNSGNFVDVLAKLNPDGGFSLDKATLTQINGGKFPDGIYQLSLQAEDKAGNVNEAVKLDFTLDTTAPPTLGFMLDSLFDSAPIGDSQTTFATVNILGQTEANATVTIKETGAAVIADAQGKFKLTGVALVIGDNSFTVNSIDLAGNVRSQTGIIKRVETANSDVVLDWNANLLNAIYTDKTAPPVASRNMAIVESAVFDAVNSFAQTYKNYHFTGTAPVGGSVEAAAASAAYNALLKLYPNQKTFFDNAFTASLAKITDGAAEDAGVVFGKTVADDILSLRSNDGASKTVTYTPGTNPGDWQPTAPGFAAALLPQWGGVTPFGLTSGAQFRPAGDPALTSDQYTAEFNRVKDLGSINSTTRTADQTQIAQFWADGAGTFTPPGHWNQIAQNVAATKGNSLLDNARLFALLDISLADAGIAAWDAKYQYNSWRPITAIQQADTDGNPNTIADPNWKPLITTPPFPEYISGHSTFSGAAATVLTSLLGDNISFNLNSLGMPGVDRQFTSFNAAATEAGISRIYGGIHFNSANIDGLATGNSVGNYVLQNLLGIAKPVAPTEVKIKDDVDTVTNLKTPIITGKATTGNIVQIFDGTTKLGEATAVNGAFEITTAVLADGVKNLTVKSVNTAGNISDNTAFSLTVDTVKPVAPTELKIKDDPDTVTNLKTPIITGKAETGTTVQIFDGTTKLGESIALNGAFEVATSALTDGVKNLTVKSIDAAGNISDNTAFSLTVDTVKPVAPTELKIKDDPDTVTNLKTPIITGKAETGTTVQIFDGTTKLGEAIAVNGVFEITTSTLTDGVKNLTVKSIDLAGNISDNTAFSLTVDTVKPVAPTEIKIKDDPDTVTNLKTPVITGKAETGTTVQIFDGTTKLGEAVAVNGVFEVTTSTLTDGVKNLTVKSIDLAGNISDNTAFSLTVDTTVVVKPVAPTEVKIKDDVDTVTNLKTPIITGKATTGTTVQIFDGATKIGEAVAVNGAFEITTSSLTDGVKNLTVKAVDSAGNASDNTAFSLTVDTLIPTLNLTTPAANAQITTGAKLQGTVDGTGSGISKVSYRFGTGTEITVPVNAQGQFNVDLNLTGLSGQQSLILKSVDTAGNTTESTILVTVGSDITPPKVALASTPSTAVNYLELTFDEPVTDASFAADKYSLKIVGGTQDGTAVTIASIQKLSPTQVRVNLAAAFGSGNYKLAVAAGIADTTGNATTAAQTFDLSVAAARLTISPANGEEMVGLNRDTVVNFGKKIDPTTVNSDNFYLIANGQRVAGKIKVSSTEEFATFFYDAPLPSSTEVRVVVDGGKITGRDGVTIDGDGDGKAGGIATADFTTLPLTRIKGTDVWGYVYDSYNKNADGSNIPLKGVTIRLDSLADVFATTDDKGYFILKDVPAPEFFVYIDGAKATGSSAAAQYASLGKPFHSVPGQSTQLIMDGTPFNVYLPPMAASDVKPLSATETTKVGFGTAAQAFLEKQFPTIAPDLWKEVKVTFNPGSAQDDAGNKATQATIIPVDPSRLPAPLPPGANPKLVISIQAGGAGGFNREAKGGSTNFDVPAPIQFPNLEGLKPGEKSLFWSFDHDAGKWIVIGTGTVSADGKTIVSDPGVGVIAPGWHFTNPGVPVSPPPPPPPCKPDPGLVKCLKRAVEDYGICVATWGIGGGIIAGLVAVGSGGTAALPAAGALTVALAACTATLNITVSRCKEDFPNNCDKPSPKALSLLAAQQDSPTGDAIGDQIVEISKQIIQLISPYAIAGQATIPQDILDQLAQLGAKANELAQGNASEYMRNLQRKSEQRVAALGDLLGNAPSYGVLYAAQIQGANGETFVVRGRTTADGQYNLILPPNGNIQFVNFYDPLTNSYGVVTPNLDPSATYRLPRFTLVAVDNNFADSDKDGMADVVEFVYGTSANKTDTDGDGINDFAAIKQGLDPLGGRGFPTGIISSLPLQGEAKAIVVEGSTTNSSTQTAYVATGSYGLAVVNATQFNNPTILGQLNLPGDATDVGVDAKLNIAAVAAGTGGLHLVNVADGMLPTLKQTLNLNANKVEVADGIAYATVNNILHAIDLSSGQELESFTIPGSGTVTGLAREGTKLYAFVSGSDTFSIIDISTEGAATLLGQVNVSIASGDVGLSVGNGVAYLAGSGLSTIDISEPTKPKLISGADTFFTARDVTLNGSGLAVVAAETQGLGVYSTTDPQKTDNFLTQIDTPGNTYGAAVASGIAFVADGTSGLQVINYLPFDNKGKAPTISINTSVIDLDPNTAGIQVQEGSNIPLKIDITDDVQVRNVELLVDGKVISNDVSFPWDLSVIAPKLTATKTSFDIQVRATDTGGNIAISNLLTLNLSSDKFAPTVIGSTPTESARPKTIPTISIKFNEAIDPTKLNTSGVTLTNLGKDGVLGGGDDIVTPVASLETRSFDKTLVIQPTGELPLGNYQLKVDASIISDRVGNSPTTPVTVNFTKRPLTSPLTIGAPITGKLVQAGDDEIYTFTGTAGQRLIFDSLLNNTTSNITIQITSPSGVSLGNYYDYYYYDNSQPQVLTETGTYRITVKSANNTTGDYSFRLIDGNAAPSITLGTTVTDSLTEGLENDVYQIEGKAGQRLFFDSLSKDATNGYWTLYGTGNQYITQSSLSTDLETTLPNDGTYLLVLNRYTSTTTTKIDYSFKVTNPPTTTAALTLGTAITSTIAQPGEQKEYTFTGAVGQRLFYDALANNTTSTIYSQLISPSGQTVFGNGDADSDRAPFTLTEAGTYKLLIDGYLDNIGDYSFKLIDAGAATAITLGDTVTSTLTPGLETDIYRITGTKGQQLYIDSLVNTPSASWVLYDPNNQYVASTNLNTDFEPTLAADGTYLLVIQGSNASENSDYSFKVTNSITTTTALTLGSTVTSTISQPGEKDIYTFTGAAGQRLYYDALSNNAASTIYAQLLSPSGQSVFYNGDADTDRNVFTLTESGTYKLILDGNQASTGDYSFKLIDTGTVSAITLGDTVTSTLTPGLETDIYRITGTKGQQLYFDSLLNTSGASWTLYSPNNQGITGTNLNTDFEPTLTTDGTYILAINGTNSSGNSNYSFKVTNPSTTTTALTLGTTTTSTISQSGEKDIYTFTGAIGQRLFYDGLGNNTTSTIYVQLISPSGQTVFYNGDADTDRAPFTLTESGTYQLILDGNLADTGDYSFKLIDAGAATAITLGDTVTSTLTPGLETDIYRITGTKGQQPYIDSLINTTSATWTLYDPNNQYLAGTNLNTDFEPTLTKDGTYLLVIDGSNSSGNSNYSFKVTNPVATATALTLGSTVTSTISQAGEQDVYTFTGAVGQRLYYDGLINNSTSTIYAQLISPSGQTIFGNGDADSDRDPITLTEAGTYKLILDGYADNTGDYSFKLIDAAAATNLTLNTNISGTLDPGLKTEIYRINGTAGQKLKFDSLLTGSVNGNWKLYNANNQLLTNNNLITDFNTTLPNDGTYLLMLSGSGANGTVNYNFQVTDVSDAPVTKSGFNTLKAGTIAAGGQDTYTFTAPAGTLVYFDSQSPSASNLNVEIRDVSNQVVASFAASSDFNYLRVNNSGNYTVTVKGINNTSTGSYSFQAIDVATAATDLTLSTPVTKTLANGAETVVYKFTGAAGQKLYYDALQSDADTVYAQLISPSGTTAFYNNSDSDTNLLTLAEGGTYYLFLNGNNTTAADYSFNLIDASASSTLELAKAVTDKLEPGLKTNIYRINGTAGERLYFNSTAATTAANWVLYSPTNQYITQANVNGNFETTLTNDGTYFFVLNGSNASGNVDYSFTVTNPPTTTAALTLGTAVTSTISQPGEMKEYTFTGAAGQRLYYDGLINNTTSTIYAQLISPSGQSVFYNGDADSDRAPFTLTEAGTYKLVIDGSGASTGDYSFKLIDAGIATAIALGDTVTSTLTPGLETDIYRITGTAGQQLYIDSLVNTTSATWTLYGLNNQYVAAATLGIDFEPTLTTDGTYLLVLDGNNASGNSDYSFKVTTAAITTTALTFGTTVASTISQPGEQDTYTFTGSIGQRLYYDGLANNNTSSIYAQLISPSGQTVFYNGDADSDRAPFTLTEAGIYKLVIDGNQASTGDYSFKIIDAGAATSFTLGDTVTSTLTPGLETDIYRINGTAGQQLYIDSLLDNNSAGWTLYDPNNQYVVGTNLSSDFEPTLTADGTYLLVLNGSNANGNSDYSFKVTNSATTTTALTLGTTTASTISQPGEKDIYTFTGAAGQRLLYDALINNTTSTIYAQLISPSGQTVFYNGDADTDRAPFTLTESGTYQLIIDGNQASTGDYSFRLIDASTATPVTLGTTVTDTLTPGLESDVYQINATAGQRLYFDSLVTSTGATWTLYGPGNQYISNNNLSGDFEANLTISGTYYLVLDGNTSNGNVNYSFKVTNPTTTSTPLTLGTTITSSIAEAGEVDEYTFTGAVGQKLYYDALLANNTFTTNAQLVSPSGQSIFFNGNADSDRGPITLNEPGTYRLILDGSSNSTGNYSFRLVDTTTAPTISLDSTISNTLNPGLKTDVYRVTGKAGQKLRFDSLISGFANSNWALYGANNQYLGGSNLGSDFEVTLTGDGTYLLVLPGYNSNGTVDYKFQVTEV